MFFNFTNIPFISIILLGVALILFVPIWFFYLRRIVRVSRTAVDSRHADLEAGYIAAHDEPASVIVFVQDDAEGLSRLLPQILDQDYPAGYEVIVVNEGESQATREVVDALRPSHPNLYLTFTPDGARNLSRKKLGLMLGIKAARNRVVVHTVSSASIPSRSWLAAMMRNFADPDVEVVIGYASPMLNDNKFGRRRRAFDFVADAVTWLTSAIAGHPYRGTEYNLAYTRDAFFNNKGFSRSINMHYGDDDIFVSEIARPDNTVVELSTPAQVRCRFGSHKRALSELMRRHEFTGRFISHASRRLMAAGVWLCWLQIALCIAAAVSAWPNLSAAVYGLVVVMLLLFAVTLCWRGAMVSLGSRKMFLTLPWLALTAPLRNARRTLRGHIRSGRNYTWC